MSLNDDLEGLAETVATDWPEIAFSGGLEAAISGLYRTHLRFPPLWTQEQCDEFLTENADTDAMQLTTQLDDLIDVVVNRYERQHGISPHDEDAVALIDAERRFAVYELEDRIEALSDELAEAAIHTAGRAVTSMTGCSPAGRRSKSKIRRKSR